MALISSIYSGTATPKKKQPSRSAKYKAKHNSYPEVPPYKIGMGKPFYQTREWRELRWKVLSKSDGCCNACGRSNKVHGIVIHIDHIKPRSRFPELELVESNLQLLCEDCNIGKGSKAMF